MLKSFIGFTFSLALLFHINLNCVTTGNFDTIGPTLPLQSIKANVHTINSQRIINTGNTYKVGESCSYNFFSLIAAGDSSILTAIKKGDIEKPIIVDQVIINYLGLLGVVCTKVAGE